MYYTADYPVICFCYNLNLSVIKDEETGRLTSGIQFYNKRTSFLTIKLTLPNMEADELPFRMCSFIPSNLFHSENSITKMRNDIISSFPVYVFTFAFSPCKNRKPLRHIRENENWLLLLPVIILEECDWTIWYCINYYVVKMFLLINYMNLCSLNHIIV